MSWVPLRALFFCYVRGLSFWGMRLQVCVFEAICLIFRGLIKVCVLERTPASKVFYTSELQRNDKCAIDFSRAIFSQQRESIFRISLINSWQCSARLNCRVARHFFCISLNKNDINGILTLIQRKPQNASCGETWQHLKSVSIGLFLFFFLLCFVSIYYDRAQSLATSFFYLWMRFFVFIVLEPDA